MIVQLSVHCLKSEAVRLVFPSFLLPDVWEIVTTGASLGEGRTPYWPRLLTPGMLYVREFILVEALILVITSITFKTLYDGVSLLQQLSLFPKLIHSS